MCNEAFNDCLTVLKFITDWFVRNKMLEKFRDAFLMKSLVKLHLMKWVFLV